MASVDGVEHENADGGDELEVASAVEPKKQLPLEPSENVRVRGWVILSFWVVVVFLGLPMWLWTTSIHRARLPFEEMRLWADGKVCAFT